MFCQNCGEQLNEEAVFCSSCGAMVSGENAKSEISVPSVAASESELASAPQSEQIAEAIPPKTELNPFAPDSGNLYRGNTQPYTGGEQSVQSGEQQNAGINAGNQQQNAGNYPNYPQQNPGNYQGNPQQNPGNYQQNYGQYYGNGQPQNPQYPPYQNGGQWQQRPPYQRPPQVNSPGKVQAVNMTFIVSVILLVIAAIRSFSGLITLGNVFELFSYSYIFLGTIAVFETLFTLVVFGLSIAYLLTANKMKKCVLRNTPVIIPANLKIISILLAAALGLYIVIEIVALLELIIISMNFATSIPVAIGSVIWSVVFLALVLVSHNKITKIQ